MIPTIRPLGDIYLRDVLFYKLRRDRWRAGDVVIIRDEKGRCSCKRIIGLGGQSVLRYGEFAELYTDLGDWGGITKHKHDGTIRVKERRSNDAEGLDDRTNGETQIGVDRSSKDADDVVPGRRAVPSTLAEEDLTARVVVPPGHVWVEGDFPPLSVDSRQYGPIPADSIRGRVVMRLWPLWREKRVTGESKIGTGDDGSTSSTTTTTDNASSVTSTSSLFVGRDRPRPIRVEDALAGNYNLVKVPARQHGGVLPANPRVS